MRWEKLCKNIVARDNTVVMREKKTEKVFLIHISAPVGYDYIFSTHRNERGNGASTTTIATMVKISLTGCDIIWSS